MRSQSSSGGVLDVQVGGGRLDADVVEEDVHGAEGVHRFGDDPAALVQVDQIGFDQQTARAQPLQVGLHLAANLLVDVGDGDGGALLRELEGRRPADAVGAPGDDYHLAVEGTHSGAPTGNG